MLFRSPSLKSASSKSTTFSFLTTSFDAFVCLAAASVKLETEMFLSWTMCICRIASDGKSLSSSRHEEKIYFFLLRNIVQTHPSQLSRLTMLLLLRCCFLSSSRNLIIYFHFSSCVYFQFQYSKINSSYHKVDDRLLSFTFLARLSWIFALMKNWWCLLNQSGIPLRFFVVNLALNFTRVIDNIWKLIQLL